MILDSDIKIDAKVIVPNDDGEAVEATVTRLWNTGSWEGKYLSSTGHPHVTVTTADGTNLHFNRVHLTKVGTLAGPGEVPES